MGSSSTKPSAATPTTTLSSLHKEGAKVSAIKQANANANLKEKIQNHPLSKNAVLLMNLEDSSTEDYDLQYLGFENAEGMSLPAEQLFSEQTNPAYIDQE